MSGRLSGGRAAAAVRLQPVDADAILRGGRRDPDGTPSGRVALGRRGDGRQALGGRRAVRTVEPVRLARGALAAGWIGRRLEVDEKGGGHVPRVTDPGADEVAAQGAGDDGHQQVVEGTARHVLDSQHGRHAQWPRPRHRHGPRQRRTVQQVVVGQREQFL